MEIRSLRIESMSSAEVLRLADVHFDKLVARTGRPTRGELLRTGYRAGWLDALIYLAENQMMIIANGK